MVLAISRSDRFFAVLPMVVPLHVAERPHRNAVIADVQRGTQPVLLFLPDFVVVLGRRTFRFEEGYVITAPREDIPAALVARRSVEARDAREQLAGLRIFDDAIALLFARHVSPLGQ